MKNKREEEKNKEKVEKEKSTYVQTSEITYSKHLSRKHKTSNCPSKRVVILKGEDLCVNQNKVCLNYFFKEEKQHQYKPCVEKEISSKLYGYNIRRTMN